MSIWTAFYWGDYLRDTSHLSLAEHGAYLLLMGHYYSTRRPLPANAALLHRVCRCTNDEEKRAVETVLREFFTKDGEVYRHQRIDAELAKVVDISAKRRIAATKSHRVREVAIAPANAEQKHQQVQSQPQSQPHKENSSSDGVRSIENIPSAATRLATLLKSQILRNAPNFRMTASQERGWAKTVDRMMRLDHRSEKEIADLIAWVQRDEFWRANVLSMEKLREKFDQLWMKSGLAKAPVANGGTDWDPVAWTKQELEGPDCRP